MTFPIMGRAFKPAVRQAALTAEQIIKRATQPLAHANNINKPATGSRTCRSCVCTSFCSFKIKK